MNKFKIPNRVLFFISNASSHEADVKETWAHNLAKQFRAEGKSVIFIDDYKSSEPHKVIDGFRYIYPFDIYPASTNKNSVSVDSKISEIVSIFKPSILLCDISLPQTKIALDLVKIRKLNFELCLSESCESINDALHPYLKLIQTSNSVYISQEKYKHSLLSHGVSESLIKIFEIKNDKLNAAANLKPTVNIEKNQYNLLIDNNSNSVSIDIKSGFGYKLTGRIKGWRNDIKNPALFQLAFDQTTQSQEEIRKLTGLAYSQKFGYFCYIQPSLDGLFECNFKIPSNFKKPKLSARLWGSKTPIQLEEELNLLITSRDQSLSDSLKDELLDTLTKNGFISAKKFITENIYDPVESIADKLEALFDVAIESNYVEAQSLILEAYGKNPTYQRGRRLANKALGKGLLRAPAEIYSEIVDDSANSAQDKRLMRRTINRGKNLDQLTVVPPKSSKPAYKPNPNCSLFFYYSCLPYQSNGYAVRTHGIMEGLSTLNRQNICYSRPGYPWDVKSDIAVNDYDQVHNVLYRHLPGVNLFTLEIDTYIESATNIIEAIAKNNKAAVLHAASNYINALPVLLAARRLGIPFVYEVRGLWEITNDSKVNFDWTKSEVYEFDSKYEALIVSHADKIIPITHGLKDELVERGGDAARMVIAPNGVNMDEFELVKPDMVLAEKIGINSKVPTIGFVGSFVAYEGLDDLIDAASIIKDSGIKFNLLLVGDGSEYEVLKKKVDQKKLNDQVFLTGRVPHDNVPSYYSLIDIAPFPRKPLKVCELVSPLKPFEAMAMGKAVLVSDVAAMKEFVTNGVNGYTFRKGSVESLASSLTNLLLNIEQTKQVGSKARTWVAEHRTWLGSARIINSVHNELTSS
ncbi:glycosyltransferase family 4 protein [Limnohabitans sp. DM1]|uniref:glycosyltransferase family 4 protein n=1 Tax=Limnohabitans sp. DM1 TaxID=1597955 RepID=UPI000B079D36|nr:glycosyltransferase family 4 protein [Limnohabitans sp. DM1]